MFSVAEHFSFSERHSRPAAYESDGEDGHHHGHHGGQPGCKIVDVFSPPIVNSKNVCFCRCSTIKLKKKKLHEGLA